MLNVELNFKIVLSRNQSLMEHCNSVLALNFNFQIDFVNCIKNNYVYII